MSDNNKEIRSDFDEYLVPCYAPMQVVPEKALGSKVWDYDGKEYIDFAGGIAVSCLGHCHPVMLDALEKQSKKVWHLSNVMTNKPAIDLAKRLTELTFADKVFFANSGAEANEAALKLARRVAIEKYSESKNEIISFKKGFHGRTFFTVTVGGQPVYSDGFGPKPGAITHLPYNDIEAFEKHINKNTCAVMIEPIQGEGGIVPIEMSFLHRLAALCKKHDAILIFDEVQTGVGRTGTLYAYESLDIIPDILTTAKSLGGGFPIAAMLTNNELAKHMKVGTHGSTYGGNPLASAVGLAVLNEVTSGSLMEDIVKKEKLFRRLLNKMNQTLNVFEEIRGKGLLLGASLNQEWKGRARDILTEASRHGLLVLIAGPDVIRFTPSLLVTEQEIEEGLKRLELSIEKLTP